MARFLVKASEFKNVCKAVNDRKLAELKKEIIEILKKQDEKDVKKAIDYFNSQEGHYTHLEKSLISGKWIQKAGYGVGTVRIWKGKKYKKIAPGKWARVFDKEGRGTNIAIGKLIARVQKIDNIEDLMAFVMQNKQRFVDENGIDLPVLDKLRAYADDRSSKLGQGNNYADMESNVVNERNKIADKEHKQNVKESNAIMDESNRKHYEAALKEVEDAIDNAGDYDDIEELEKERKQLLKKLGKKPAEKKTETKEVPFGGVDKNDEGEGVEALSMADKINEVAEKGQLKVGNTTYKVDKDGKEWAVRTEIMNAIKCKEGIDRINDEFEKKAKSKLEAELKEKLDKIKEKLPEIVKEGKLEENKKLVEERLKRYSEGASEGLTVDAVISNHKKDVINKLENHVKDNELFTQKNTDEIELLGNVDHQVELCSINTSAVFYAECKKLLDEYSEEESEADNPSKKEEKQYKETKKMLEDKIAEFDKQLKMFDNNPNENTKRLSKDVEKQKKTYVKMLENLESEYEKTQNRSEAMKGNKNAYKGGHDDEPVHNKVSKNGVYYNFDGFSHGLNRAFRQAKNLPQNIKDNINNSVKRYLDYVDNYTDEGYKKVANDMIKNPEKYHNISMEDFTKETGYDKEDVREIVKLKYSMEFADKLRNFNLDETMISKDVEQNFRDEIYPVSLKQNIEEGFLPDQIADIEAQKAAKAEKKENVVKKPSGKLATTNPDKLKPIATNEKIADGKVKMPYSKELSDEIKQLVNTALKDKNAYSRAFLTKVYYENGNLVATDGKALKILKVGELDGIENGSYVDIDNSKDGITITKDEDFTKNYKYPNYNRVLPDNNKEKIVLDNKALLSKIRELKKDGSITGKDSYVTFDIKGNDLMLDGVKVGDVSAAKFDDDEEANFFNMDVNILTPYLKGESSELISSPNNEKAMYIGDESTINVIMPQNKWTYRYDSNGNQIKEIRRKDYDSQRASKAQEDEIKASRKAAIKQVNQEYVDDTINRVKQSINKPGFADKMVSQLSEWKTEHLKNLYKQAKVDVDHLMETKDFLANTFGSYTNKHFNTSPSVLIAQNYAMKQFPQIVKEIERLLTERGEKIEKSLFDDFIVDVFEADEDEEFEEDKENESLFNDYSAEQPELFNSTEMKVQEAFNRCNCCL